MKKLINKLNKEGIISEKKKTELEETISNKEATTEEIILEDSEISITEEELFKIKSKIVDIPTSEDDSSHWFFLCLI